MWKCPACRRMVGGAEYHARFHAVNDAVCPRCNFEPLRNFTRLQPPADDDPTWPVVPPAPPAPPPHWIVAESVISGWFCVEPRLGGPLQKRKTYRRRPDAQAVADWLNERDAGYPPHPWLMP